MSVKIREATPADADRIAQITRSAFASQCALYDDPDLPPMSDTAESVLEAMARGVVLVAEENDEIVGSVRGEQREGSCSVGRLVVDPARQNRGIGRLLAEAIEGCFPAAERFEIFTGHLSEGPLHLYESLGYVRERCEPVHERLSLVFLSKPGAR